MLARTLGHIIILVHFRSKRIKYNFIQHYFCDLGSYFEALESVLLIFFLGFASKSMIELTLVPQNAYLGSQKQ
jgi:hypothetical protein